MSDAIAIRLSVCPTSVCHDGREKDSRNVISTSCMMVRLIYVDFMIEVIGNAVESVLLIMFLN